MTQPVYLDWAATTPADPELMRRALELSLAAYGNPSSSHWAGKQANSILEESRTRLLGALGMKQGSLIFTASGTEADHIPMLALLKHFNRVASQGKKIHIIISGIEHAAIDCQARMLQKTGIEISWVAPDTRGHIVPEAVASHIRKETALISVMAVNNETGALQDIRGVSTLIDDAASTLKIKKPWFHVDAVQMLGKLPVAEYCMGADSIALSAHKIRGPKGVGALWLGRPLESFVCGGGQEKGIRPGTENLFGALAFSLAGEKAQQLLETYVVHAQSLELRLLEGVARIKGAVVVPERKPKDNGFVPSIVSLSFLGVGGETMVRALSDRGIAISTGSACSSRHKEKGRRILKAMGVPEDISFSSIRVSTGILTSEHEIDIFLEQAEDLYRTLKT